MITLLPLLASVLLALTVPDATAGERAFAVITAPDAVDHRLSVESVGLIFRRKQNHWENGARIQPVNLPSGHPLRHTFSQAILGQAPEALEEYWRDMYFHGVLPPHVLGSEEAVMLFVASTPGAIGYVSTCVPDHKVNVVLMLGEVPPCPR